MSYYYSLDAILAEEERVPVTFVCGCTGLGRELDASCDADDLPAGARAELPLWLFGDLHGRGMVAPRLPRCFGKRTRDDLAAEPAACRLREQCPYWFDFGLALAAACGGEPAFAGLATLVASAFRARYSALLSRAHTAAEAGGAVAGGAVARLLTREERQVFDAGRESMQAFQRWRYNTEERVEAAPIMRALQRRKLEPAAVWAEG